jgi:radical SAM protein with 4Fe4S-binding SPASM domain
MSKETAFKIIKQSYDLGVNSLKFNWRGESTVNPIYADVTAFAKSLAKGTTFVDRLANSNFKIPVNNRDHVFKGLANLTKVKISYDSFSKEVFETQRAGGNHDLTTENIDKFYVYGPRLESGTKMIIQAVRTNLNKDEDIAGICKERWPDAEISIRDMVAGRVDKDLSDYEHRERDNSNRQSCLQAHVRLIFNHAGDAMPCCPDIKEQLNLGNIHNIPLKRIWTNGLALRKSLKDKSAFDDDPCKNCSSFETYKGFKPTWDS